MKHQAQQTTRQAQQVRPQKLQAQHTQQTLRPQGHQAQAQTQTTQGQPKPVLEFFHKASEDKHKKLVLAVSERGGVILRFIEREGEGQKSIAFSLNRTETISLAREIEFYLMGVVKPTPNVSGRPTVVEFFHYNDQSGQYKRLTVEVFEDGGLALVLREGEKGRIPDGIVFSLSRAEAIHLVEELKLLFQGRRV
jgi:hypothetical protein